MKRHTKSKYRIFTGFYENLFNIILNLETVVSCIFKNLLQTTRRHVTEHNSTTWIAYLNRPRVVISLCTCKKVKVKVKQSHYRPGETLRVPAGWGCQISTQSAHEGDKAVSPTDQPPLLPRKYSWYSFSVTGWVDPRAIVRSGRIMSMKNSSDTIGNRTRYIPACSAVPHYMRADLKERSIRGEKLVDNFPHHRNIAVMGYLLKFGKSLSRECSWSVFPPQ